MITFDRRCASRLGLFLTKFMLRRCTICYFGASDQNFDAIRFGNPDLLCRK